MYKADNGRDWRWWATATAVRRRPKERHAGDVGMCALSSVQLPGRATQINLQKPRLHIWGSREVFRQNTGTPQISALRSFIGFPSLHV